MTQVADVLAQVPQRIELDGLVVRSYTADDMPQVVDVVNRNLDHLRPFMPWAQEPATVEAQTAWWRSTLEPDDSGVRRDLALGIFDSEGRLLGGTGFHRQALDQLRAVVGTARDARFVFSFAGWTEHR